METSKSLKELTDDTSPSCKLDEGPVQTVIVSVSSDVGKREILVSSAHDRLTTASEQELSEISVPGQLAAPFTHCEPESDPKRVLNENRGTHVFDATVLQIKKEGDIGSKECVLCIAPTSDTFDIYLETTCGGQVTLCSYICKVADLSLDSLTSSNFVCYSCFELLNLTERAEIEYMKQRALLLDIIGKNRRDKNVFNPFAKELDLKAEHCKRELRFSSEDDEPLACMKPTRHAKSKLNSLKSSPLQSRHYSSDEDFYWKEENEEDFKSISGNFKRTRRKRAKDIKEEVDQIDLPEILKVNLKELDSNGDSSEPNNLKKIKTNKTSKKKKKLHRTSITNSDKSVFRCALCNRSFTKKGFLEQHLEKHKRNPKPYICEVCGKRFRYRKLCDAHALMHQGIADWKCVPCNKLFPTKVAFLRHDKIHNGTPNNQCDLCGKSFIHQSSLRNHKIAHAGVRKYKCDACGLALLSNASLTRHKLVHSGEKKYKCEVCGKKFARNSNMHTHMKTHSKEKGRPRRSPPPDVPGRRKRFFRCDICTEQFDRLFKLECHLVDDHKVHLKKGRPKPRHTMKKMQRAQQAAASVVSAIATAMGSRKSLTISFKKPPMDAKPSSSSLNTKTTEATTASAPTFKTSPPYNSLSPGTSYMSPPQVTVEPLLEAYQNQTHPAIRSLNTVLPHMTYGMGAEYLGRLQDYTHE